jgi:hypothetical protein
MSDPRTGPVHVEVNGTAANLLIKLMQDLNTDDPMSVLSRALGLLDQAIVGKKQGRRVGVYDPESTRFVDLVV